MGVKLTGLVDNLMGKVIKHMDRVDNLMGKVIKDMDMDRGMRPKIQTDTTLDHTDNKAAMDASLALDIRIICTFISVNDLGQTK